MIAKTQYSQTNINFSDLMKQLLGLLTTKEKDIIERRFAIGRDSRETLDRIGRSYSITRERVRQIEFVAIKKLARIAQDPSMRTIHNLAYAILTENGGAMSEDLLTSEMLKNVSNPEKIDVNSMKLAMRVSERLTKQEKNQFFRAFWKVNELPMTRVKSAMKDVQKVMKKKEETVSFSEIAASLKNYPEALLKSVLYIDWNFLETEEGWGLKSWRFINPRSIKDRVMIILKNSQKPLHFTAIMQEVLQGFPGKKTVTPQAIHNELIRHDEFVLVGRGLYGLREWGLAAGTVCDLIRSVLIENKGPMKRQDIIKEVSKKRQVRLGTISLNLQKYPFFKRVGRAVYDYDTSLDKRSRRKYSQ